MFVCMFGCLFVCCLFGIVLDEKTLDCSVGMVHSSSVIASSCCIKVTLVQIGHNTEHSYNNNNNNNNNNNSNPPILFYNSFPHFHPVLLVL